MEDPSPPTQMCRNGCGFYANNETDGMCSKCHKESLKKRKNSAKKMAPKDHGASVKRDTAGSSKDKTAEQDQIPALNTEASKATKRKETYSSATTSVSVITSDKSSSKENSPITIKRPLPSTPSSTVPESDDSPPKKPKKCRCAECNKKVGLTGFSCRCGKTFCGLHRYSDQHDCEFDYKADGQAKIRRENPVVDGEKIQKI